MSCILILNNVILNLSLYNFCMPKDNNIECKQNIHGRYAEVSSLTIQGMSFEDFKKEVQKQCKVK